MERSDFIANVSASLGRRVPPRSVEFDARYVADDDADRAAEAVRIEAVTGAEGVINSAVDSLTAGGWNVHRATTVEDVGEVVSAICSDAEIRSAVRTGHLILDHARVDAVLAKDGVECIVTESRDASSDEERQLQIESAKQRMFEVDAGITGGDYVIAETGTLVIHPGAGIARLASLAPPIHIAVVHVSQVLPSLDALFLLEHVDLRNGKRASAMNLISGPSRTGDIEATIVHGIHGPIETHIVLVG